MKAKPDSGKIPVTSAIKYPFDFLGVVVLQPYGRAHLLIFRRRRRLEAALRRSPFKWKIFVGTPVVEALPIRAGWCRCSSRAEG